jgi:glycosyltransferase involved in cell wall biosynthesis
MEISVIVPVYNKEVYIKDCISNILSQKFDSFEVIVVDDGSTDKSGEICDCMFKEDSRLHIYHTENGGVTAARRYGVEHSVGKYIMFVDADDMLLPDAMRILHDNIIKTDADEVIATYRTQKGRYVDSGFRGIQNTEMLIKELLACRNLFCVLWGIIFKRELLEGCLNTHRQIRSGEDIMMQIQCLMKDPRVFFIADCVYLYNEGLPNDRTLELDDEILYDEVLKESLQPKWDTFESFYNLHRIKTYENFLADNQIYVFWEYYIPLQDHLTRDMPWKDRLIMKMDPRVSRYIVSYYKKMQERKKKK